MLSPLVRTALLALLSSLSLACHSTGGGTSFLLFGGSDAPQQDLVECVHGAQGETHEAQEDFAAAFRIYQRLTAPQAVELEDLSDDYEDSIESCQERAHDFAERVEAVQKEADELFKGWNEELARFANESLRKKSAAMLQDTQARAQRVTQALASAQSRMEPVLLKLQDYALFFHHNLNARAIATLEDTYKDFDAEFGALKGELARAQSEIEAFLTSFDPPAPAEKK